MQQEPLMIEETTQVRQPRLRVCMTYIVAVLALAGVVCLMDFRSMHSSVLGALVVTPRPYRTATAPRAQATKSQIATAPVRNAPAVVPLKTFRMDHPSEDPTVDCWLDPDSKWDDKHQWYLCASHASVLKAAGVDGDDSY